MTPEKIRELLPLYALGALDADERRRVEEALESDPELERELAEWSAVSETIAKGVEPVAPSDTARARLLRDLPPAASAERSAAGWGWAAAAVLALVAGWLTWVNFDLKDRLANLAETRDIAVSRASRLSIELRDARADLRRLLLAQSVVGSPRARTVRLAGLESRPDSSGQTFVDETTRRAAFFATDLPPAPAHHTYQLWFIADGTPVSAGVFDPTVEGTALVLVEDVAPTASIQAWAVTIEPDGGVPQPTGEMVLKG